MKSYYRVMLGKGSIHAEECFAGKFIGSVEDPSSFAMEEHLEDFLVKNWPHTEFGKEYDYQVSFKLAKA